MLYHFKKDAKGNSKLEPISENPIPVVPIIQPSSTTLGANFTKRIKCTVEGCGKLFATEGVMAMHFNRNHRQGDSKDEWRSFAEKLNVAPSPNTAG